MFDLFGLWFVAIFRIFRTHRSLVLENLALRQQLAVLKRKHPRSRLGPFDKLFWVVARSFWIDWEKSLLLVLPETVVRWHQAGFKLYWAMLCKARKRIGDRRISKQIRDLIFQMVAENPTWGAPRIHGELLMLGFEVSEMTVSRWMRRVPRRPEPCQTLAGFSSQSSRSHRPAMDIFTMPTLTFNVLLLLPHQP
jgi:putative transposase